MINKKKRQTPKVLYMYFGFSVILLLAIYIFLFIYSRDLLNDLWAHTIIIDGAFLGYLVLRYFFFTYKVGDDHIEISHGIITSYHDIIPFSKIQKLETKNDPLLVLFGIGKVNIWTSSQFQLKGKGKNMKSEPTISIMMSQSEAREFQSHFAKNN